MKKRIVLVCLAGMTTNLLVNRMRRAADMTDKNIDIVAISASEVEKDIQNEQTDIYLLGPQVRYLKKELKQKLNNPNVPVKNIDMTDYGLMNGSKVFAYAERLLDDTSE
ncbi:PTS sugar transporter subunit IIB [Vagococcus luciliae]|uniref:PTS system galactose-specific EIIB component n=1 Tax=Vagococcus luciliae TaxID=2920380 RepID=A0ABY5NYH8_9ENTE|nr:PTS sugar transporter subunit IIB [Vagococcus luciliae]UUV98634.1 PTS system galactose-specific EIIB component [Vagococcus luciliae]